MDFMNKLGQKLSEGTKLLSNTTDKLLEITDYKLEISRNEAEIDDLKMFIGELVYKNYLGSNMSPTIIQDKCREIQRLTQNVNQLKERMAQMKGVMYCKKCGSIVKREENFCINCGSRLN